MNNAFLEDIPQYDPTPALGAEESRLVSLLEALKHLQQSEDWKILQETLFGSLPNILERELKEEAMKISPDSGRLNRLAGQLEWAEKYADLSKLERRYRTELQAIRTRLNASI